MPYAVEFSDQAKKEYTAWATHNPARAAKIDELIESIGRDPYRGIGKPEQLKHGKRGYWSRRITQHHRITYEVKGNTIYVLHCYGHYE